MDKNDIIIIDYGMGNIRSILNKISNSGLEGIVSDDVALIKKANKLILPGVGHFQNGMKNLKSRNLIDILNKKVLVDKTPILGICLGMQLMTKSSEEGNVEGLCWFNATTKKFQHNDIRYKVPHMGWNTLQKHKESILLKNIPENKSFYFVHSYHVVCHESADILTTTNYGYEFVSSIQKENLFGTQFHPEKSHEWGNLLLNNFLKI
jgi:imidazole glycerol-phosphate synthase subunit HisH